MNSSVALVREADAIRTRIVGRYREVTPSSAREHARAAGALAGGTTGNLRHFHPYPIYFRAGSGPRMVDLDGTAYIDCFLCNGPLLLGHRHPAIERAIANHGSVGSLVVNPTFATDLAVALRDLLPFAERVRFLNSGTEAVMTAVRVARAFTGRSKVVKFFGHYHGQDDQFLVGLGPSREPLGAGVPSDAYASTVVVKYGDLPALESVLATGDVAAVLLDPAMHSGGLWGSSPDYLRAVRDATRRHGTVLIFDEVITGFRLTAAGAQAYYGVTPDLATYAKALSAGEKLAAVVGRADILAGLDPDRPASARAVFQSGTGNDGTAPLAAGLAAVATYRELESAGEYERLFTRSARLASELRALFAQFGVPAHVNQLGPMLQLFLTEAPANFEACAAAPSGPVALFYTALIGEGVLLSLPTSNHIYLSFTHGDAEIDAVLDAARAALSQYDFATLVRAAAVS
jgi:glutamate-1-semialdehyde 2,1-aminomutase